jgi:Zn-dependent protease
MALDDQRVLSILMNYSILLFSLCLHEFGHAAMADYLGDPTPRMLGRLTINPKAHADLIGTVLFPLLRLIFPGSLFFGWAKPVPITPENFKNPRKDGALVAFAGPLANMGLCLIALAAFAILDLTNFFPQGSPGEYSFHLFFSTFFWINFALAVFNLLPVFPLDGSWILKALLPGRWAYQLSRYDRYGGLVLLGVLLFFRNALDYVFTPVIGGFFLTLHLVGLGHIAQYLS